MGNMKKGKIIGNTLIAIGMLLMIVAVLTDIATPLLGIAGLIVTCGGLIHFLFFGDARPVECLYHFME